MSTRGLLGPSIPPGVIDFLETVYVRSETDLPNDGSGGSPLLSKHYLFLGKEIFLDRKLIPPKDLPCVLSGEVSVGSHINHTGGGAMLENTDLGTGELQVQNLRLSAPAGKIQNLSPATGQSGTISYFNVLFSDTPSLGEATDLLRLMIGNCRMTGLGGGLTTRDVSQVVVDNINWSEGQNNPGTSIILLRGASDYVHIIGGSIQSAGLNETVFDIEAVFTLNTGIVRDVNVDVGSNGGIMFASGSADQTTRNWLFIGNTGIPDSAVRMKMRFTGNTLATTINNAGVPERTKALWTDGVIDQRFGFQDLVTFDNTTNTLNTTFDHGFTFGELITLKEQPSGGPLPTGTLPPELVENLNYFVRDVPSSTSVTISLISGGPVEAFSTNGSGTNYYRHNKGLSASGHVIYLGATAIAGLRVDGWKSIAVVGGGFKDVRCSVAKTDINFAVGTPVLGSTASVTSNKPQTSNFTDLIDLEPGEGLITCLENIDDANDLRADAAFFVFYKS